MSAARRCRGVGGRLAGTCGGSGISEGATLGGKTGVVVQGTGHGEAGGSLQRVQTASARGSKGQHKCRQEQREERRQKTTKECEAEEGWRAG